MRFPAPDLRLSGPSLVLLVVLPALAVNPWGQDLFDLPKSLAVQLLIVCVLFWAVLSWRQAQMLIPVAPVSIPLIGLLVLGGLSASRSLDPLFGLLEVAHLALLVVLFHLLLGRREVGERVSLIFQTMAVVGAVSALYGLLQLVGLDVIHTQHRFVPYSFFGNKNFAAEFVLLVLPPALALTVLARRRRDLILWSLVSFLLVLHLAATQARAALAGLVLGLLGAGLFCWRSSVIPDDPVPSRRRWLLVGAIVVTGFVLFLFPQPMRAFQPIAALVLNSEDRDAHRLQEILTRASPGKTLTESGSLRARLLLWNAGVRLVRDHPWMGVGPTNVAVVFPMRYEPVEYWWPEWLGEPFLHNELLQIAAELGLPSLVLVLWLLVLVATILRRALGTSRPVHDQLCLAASLCALIGIGVDSLFSFPWHLPAHRLYAVIHGACFVVLASEGAARGFVMARSSGFAVGGVCLLLVVLGPVRLQIAEVYAASGWESLNRGARAETLAAHRAAAAWFPHLFDRNELFRQALDPRPQYEKAVQQFQEAVQKNPQDQVALANLGRALSGAGRLEEAVDISQQLLEKKPGALEILRRLIDLELRRGRLAEAHRLYDQLTVTGGCNGQLLFNLGVGYHLAGERETAKAMWERAVACDRRLAGMPEAWRRRFAR